MWGLHMGWQRGLLHITAEVLGGFSAKFLLCLVGQTMSSSNPRKTPVGIVGQVWMLLHCQASPEGLGPAAPKVGQDLLTRPSLTWKEQLATPGVSSPERNDNLTGHPSLTGCVQEGVTPQAAWGQTHLPIHLWPSWGGAWLPTTSQGQQFEGGLWDEDF